ncbi:MAG: hypothetical protein IKL56_04575 [Bacteroidaceae bacterium]|nr:hypothetical protein [Bacteroidaceae bacterium]
MKKIFTSLFLAAALSVQAQYIPNGTFESWKGGGNAGNTYQSSDGSFDGGSSAFGLRQRPGDEPAEWQGSSVNQKVWMEKKETLIEQSEGVSGSAVRMQNKYVGVIGIGSNAPGFISFATPWVYAISNVNACDGGVYGGMPFTYTPDAIEGWYKRSGGTGEDAHIIVYMWTGTFKSNIKSSAPDDVKEDVDRAIMGKTSDGIVQAGRLIASCDYAFSTTANDDWQKIVVPIDYVAGTEHLAPEKVNVIISSGDYWNRSNIKDGSVLEADDVKFVYYSELASLEYDGKDYFVAGKESYTIGAEYDASKLSLTSNGRGATIEKSYDELDKVLTVKVKGNDYAMNNSNIHSYTVKFDEEGGEVTPTPDPDPTPTPDDVDYTPAFTGTKTREDRWINEIKLTSEMFADESANTITVNNDDKLCYNDYTGSVTMKAAAGETVTVTLNIGDASWMNAYVYIDEEKNGFTASIAEGSYYEPAGDLLSYSFYNNGAAGDAGGWDSAGKDIAGDDRSTVALPSFVVPEKSGTYRVRVKLDWCNIDPAGDRDGRFGDFMENGGQIVDFMLKVVNGEVDYTPTNTGTRNYTERDINAVKFVSDDYGEVEYDLTATERASEYLDLTETELRFVAAPGELVSVDIVTDGSWVNHYIYIDYEADGFTAGIADGSNYEPTGDLVSYSFYNNGSSSDESGWNCNGVSITGNDRSKPEIPGFAVPQEVGTYRLRIKQDWCSIDPMGDSNENFGGTFSNYGGQIIDVNLLVSDETGINELKGENGNVKTIYDLQGRKVDNPTKGIYIINGKKVLVK